MKWRCAVLFVLLALLLSGCQGTERGEPTLIVTREWLAWEQDEPTVKNASGCFAGIEEGLVIYDEPPFGTISVIAVNRRRIRLRIDNSLFVEERDNGTIDLTARRIKTLTVRRGEEKKIAPGVVDVGFSLSFRFD